ncbi:MAG: translation initiation factor IF-2 N-terminal domain-containing protein, partial [Heyndrickxia sp.]
MGKTRVYEYAKSNNISSKDVISKLKEMNVEVTNHMSTIDGNAIEKLDSIFKKNNKNESNNKNGSGKPNNQNQPQKAATTTTRI